MNDILKDILQSFGEFKKVNRAKLIGEIKGWHSTISNVDTGFMFMVLLDKEKYDF